MTGYVYTHPGQDQMQVEVILASQGPFNKPIYTLRMRYPRPIHGEIMTHRVFGRNARSSRAVPVKTMLNEVRTIPYVPWHWGKNQKGMQAEEECNERVFTRYPADLFLTRETAWLRARDMAANTAEAFMEAGYHKQNPNRLLEPFSWIDTLITSTEWKNFLWLREHKDAEPHLQDLAALVATALHETVPEILAYGDWHLPYITLSDINYGIMRAEEDPYDFLCKISAARCARISYKPFNGDASYDAEIDRYNMLVNSDRVHASPLEHQAKADTPVFCPTTGVKEGWQDAHLHGNLNGYVQARKLVPNEAMMD